VSACRDCDGAGCPECALPRRGSGSPSEAYYRSRGYHRLFVRLPLDAIDLLDRLVEAVGDAREQEERDSGGTSRGEVLDALLRCAPAADELAAGISLRNRWAPSRARV
jgi:hypothetical protein